MQRNWIGRSDAARASRFRGRGRRETRSTVFTTRPDTLFGATYMVLAPEHALVDEIAAAPPGRTAPPRSGPAARRRRPRRSPPTAPAAAAKSEVERQADAKEKTGVFTGAYATNPVNGEQHPGLHRRLRADGLRHRRDHGGARRRTSATGTSPQAFDLPIVRDRPAAADDFDGRRLRPATAPSINSANDEISLDGLGVAEAKAAITAWLAAHGAGEAHGQLQAARLAVQPAAVLGRAVPDRLRRGPGCRARCPSRCCRSCCPRSTTTRRAPSTRRRRLRARAAAVARRPTGSTSTLDLGDGPQELPPRDQHDAAMGRFLLVRAALPRPANDRALRRPGRRAVLDGPAAADGDCGGVDLYVGGVEHAVLHLLYARFWHKVLYDLGHVVSSEPFRRLFNQGYIQAVRLHRRARLLRAGRGGRGARRAVLHYAGRAGQPRVREDGQVAEERRHPGRDVRRATAPTPSGVYEMSMGPLDVSRPWETRAVVGSQPLPAAAVARSSSTRRPASSGVADEPSRTRRPCGGCTDDRRRPRRTWPRCGSTPRSPS